MIFDRTVLLVDLPNFDDLERLHDKDLCKSSECSRYKGDYILRIDWHIKYIALYFIVLLLQGTLQIF